MIGLVDGNNFFVSCERIFDPSLEGKPVAVLSNNDGCVISRSQEFKNLQIPMGTPYFQLREAEKYHGLIFRSSNYELYGDISRRIVAVLREIAQDVEQYSIDEAFIQVPIEDIEECHRFGQFLRRRVLRWVGIPCGVGFAKTKTLAKIANHIGKKRPEGVFVMPEDPSAVLATVPVNEVWGVGRRLAPKLERLGIRNAQQLAEKDDDFLLKRFNISLARTALELRGMEAVTADSRHDIAQSLTCSRSFGRPVLDFADLAESVAHYAAQAAAQLRRDGLVAAGVNVYFQYHPEAGPPPREGGFTSTTLSFPAPTASTGDIIKAISPKLPAIFIPGRRYKKSGVLFFGLESTSHQQLQLFSNREDNSRKERLAAAMDDINRHYGRGTLFNLAEGISRPWSMKRERLSPSYTTSWKQLLEVK
ncbi:MAG: Y-family DNA polymerase [Lentisphaeria bacterium]